MKTIKLKAWGETYKLNTIISNYRNNGNIYIGLISEDGEPFADLTVNIKPLAENCSAVDTNNCPWAEELINEYGLGKQFAYVQSGFCNYPVYEFDMEKVKEYSV